MSIPDTPELDKQKRVIDSGQAETVQEFLEWLDERLIVLGRYQRNHRGRDIFGLFGVPHDQLMAEFFGIDLKKIETERRAILDAIRRDSSEER